jgi:hypothetical protein
MNDSPTRASIDILKVCPRLRALIRPRHLASTGLRFDFEAQCLPFPSLERLEWWYNNEAERSGGINSLSAVLSNAPNITYLFIGGLPGRTRTAPHPLSLPKLTTLRLRLYDGLLLHRIVNHWSQPALSHLVLDGPGASGVDNLPILWKAFGPQLRTVQFGRHLRFLLENTVSLCLQRCPELEAMYFFAFFTAHLKLAKPHYSLRTVGLHAGANPFLTEQGAVWTLLEAQFDALLSDHVPCLQRIVMYGDWKDTISHPRFESILHRARMMGRCIVYPCGMAVSHSNQVFER